MSRAREAAGDLVTLRDWLRYATSRFNEAGLAYGHGTTRAVDEAAYLLLHCLHLAPDTLDPWLDARLTTEERQRVADVIETRITTRRPASYITGEAWIQGHSFTVDERVIVPRSFIGELLGDRLSAIVADPDADMRVLDLCTGSGCLAILAALAFEGARVDACDLSEDALDVARINVRAYGLQDRIRLVKSDIFSALAGERYDLIISNPPYVTAAAVAAFPPEHRAEPTIAHLGGEDGMDLVRRILAEAGAHLAPGGQIVVEVGQGRGVLDAEFAHLPFLWLDTAESEGEVFALAADAFAEPGRRKRK